MLRKKKRKGKLWIGSNIVQEIGRGKTWDDVFTTWSKWKLKSQTKTNAALYCEGGKMHSLEPLARQPKIGFYLVTSHGQVVHSREERGVLCLVAYLGRLVLSYFVLECWLASSTRQKDFFSRCATDNRRTESFLLLNTRAGTNNIVFFRCDVFFSFLLLLFRSNIFFTGIFDM